MLASVAHLDRRSGDLNSARENIRARTGGFRTKDFASCDFGRLALTASAIGRLARLVAYLEASRAFPSRIRFLLQLREILPLAL